MTSRLRTLTLAAAGALVLALPVGVSATPVANGCPASATPTSIESLGPDYQVPGQLDSTANGGNGDGWVCAFPLPGAVGTAWGAPGFQVYQFFENNLPAEGRP